MGNSTVAVYSWNQFGAAVLGASVFIVGMGFTALGLTLLPIVGLFVGLGCFALAQGLWSLERTKDLPVLIGHFDDRKLPTADALPVVILSMSRKRGAAYDFDAATVDPASIRIGPNSVPLLGGSDEHGYSSPKVRDVDEDGNLDFIGYFSPGQAGVTQETKLVCIRGLTKNGEPFKGCGAFSFNEAA
jgi:hypothetical protein